MDGIGEGHGGDAVHHRLQRGTQGAGVGDVVARVVAVIDAGENVIGLFLQDVLQRQTGRMNGIIIDNKNLHRSYSLLYIILQDYTNGFEFPHA